MKQKLNAAISATLVIVLPIVIVAAMWGVVILIAEYWSPWMAAALFIAVPVGLVWWHAYQVEMRAFRRGEGSEWIK